MVSLAGVTAVGSHLNFLAGVKTGADGEAKAKKRGHHSSWAAYKEVKGANANEPRKQTNTPQVTHNEQISLYTVPELPAWFPSAYAPAVRATRLLDDTVTRQMVVHVRAEVTQRKRLYRVPRTSYIANTYYDVETKKEKDLPEEEREKAREQRVSRALFTYAQLWPYVVARIEASDMGEGSGLEKQVWKDTARRRLPDKYFDLVLQNTGVTITDEERQQILVPLEHPDDERVDADYINTPDRALVPSMQDLEREPSVRDLRWAISAVEETECRSSNTTRSYCALVFGANDDQLDANLRAESKRGEVKPSDWATRKKTHWVVMHEEFTEESLGQTWGMEHDVPHMYVRSLQDLGGKTTVLAGRVKWVDYEHDRVIWLSLKTYGFARMGGERFVSSRYLRMQRWVDDTKQWQQATEGEPTTRMWPGLW